MMRREFAAAVLGTFVAVLAVGSAFGAARMIRRDALRESHQQPTPERWFESGTRTSPDLITRGRKIFAANCVHCHGSDARGDEGPDLHALQVSDRYVARVVTAGIKGEMPAFAKKLKRDDTVAITAYLRTLE